MKINLKKAFNKKRTIAVLAVLLVVFVMVFSNPDFKEFFLNSDSVEVDFKTGVDYEMMTYGKDMLLVNNEGISAIDKNGREVWNVVCNTTSPAIEVKNDYILHYDMNGKTIKTFERDKTIAQIQTENEILCARMNKNGYIAVATDELGYKGMVTLYNKDGKELFKWHSGLGYIGSIDISSKNTIAVSQIITNKEEIFSRIVIIEPDPDKEETCIAELKGIVMKLNYRDDQKLVAVSENGFYCYRKNGKNYFSVDFEGKTPISCEIKNQDNMVFAFDSGLNNTVLESYSASGKLRGTYNSHNKIKAFDVNGECILAVNPDGMVRLNPKGNIKKEISYSKDIKDICIFAGRDRILSMGGSSAEIIKFK